jgi:hypothetical protein
VRWLLVLSAGLSAPAVAMADGAAFTPAAYADRELTFELAADPPNYILFVFPKTRGLRDPDRPLLPLRSGEPVTVSGRERSTAPRYKVPEALVVAIPAAVLAELRGEPPTEDWLAKRDDLRKAILVSRPERLTRRTPLYNPRELLTARYRAELAAGEVRLVEVENDEGDWWKGGGVIVAGCVAALGAIALGLWVVRRGAARRGRRAAEPFTPPDRGDFG